MNAPRKFRRSGAFAPRWLRIGTTVAMAMAAITILATGWHFREHLPRPPESIAPIERVVVEGPFENVTTTEVENAVLPYLTGGFFTVDLEAIRTAAQSLPWVRSAQVMREWPDRVRILVTEERAYLRWGEDGLINEYGQLFVTGQDAAPAGLPRLDGPAGTERALAETWVDLDRRLGACATPVVRLEMDARRALTATLEGGLVLQLGRGEQGARVDRFCEVAMAVLSARLADVAYVDLRYTNGFAVGWRKGDS